MADIQEVDKVFVRSDGTLVVTVKGSEPPRYVEVKPFSSLDASAFRYGAGQFGVGSMVATLAHGLGATPSLVILTSTNVSGAISLIGANSTYIRAQIHATLPTAQVFSWLAGR